MASSLDACPACDWGDELPNHRHDDAEDGPRSECCEHSCEARS